MDRIAALISLNETKKTIDEMIDRMRNNFDDRETDTRKLLIILLSILGAIVVIGVIAYAVYRHFSADFIDDYDDIDDLFDDEYDEDPEVLSFNDDTEN